MRKHANLKTAGARAEYTQVENIFIPVAPLTRFFNSAVTLSF